MRAPPTHTSRRRTRAAAGAARALALAILLACCHRGAQIDLPPLPPERDAAVGALSIPDGAVPCSSDADCDDGIACTKDFCLPGGYCVRAANSSLCSNGVFCDGEEVCDPSSGCRSGTPENCNDDDVCTVDSCDEANKRCAHDPRDFDHDGESDWHCPGGTDCDDLDPMRGSQQPEICGDMIDNDCDDQVDESDCVSPSHDSCEDALDVSAGGSFAVSLSGAAADYALSCANPNERDVAFSFTLSEPRDVTLVARGLLPDNSEETATVAVRTRCDDPSTEDKCSHGFPAQVRIRALPAGSYFAIVSSDQAVQVVLEASFDPPTAPATNTTCDHPIDIGAGGRFEGNFVDAGDDQRLACGFMGAEDLTYRFTLDKEQDVELSALSLSGGRMSFEVRGSCDDPATSVRCVSDAPARARLYQLPAGTYYVVLEGPTSREVDFSLDVAFLDPSSPPPGDGCGDPLELALGTQQADTLADRQDLVSVVCGCSQTQSQQGCNQFLPDIVYHVHVDKPTDLGLHIDGGSALMVYDFRSDCADPSSQLACGDGAMVDGRLRNVQAGDYSLVLESPAPANDPASFTVELDKLPRTVPVPVDGNDTCASAFDVPSDGGLFEGDTLGMIDDYQAVCGGGSSSADAVFHLALTRRSRVTASLEASFDTVLYRYSDTGKGADSCQPKAEAACNDDSGQGSTNSALSEVLATGDYYYVVDGFNDSNSGKYLLDISVTPQ